MNMLYLHLALVGVLEVVLFIVIGTAVSKGVRK